MRLQANRTLNRDRIMAQYHIAGTTAMMAGELGVVKNSQPIVKNLRIIYVIVFRFIPLGKIWRDGLGSCGRAFGNDCQSRE